MDIFKILNSTAGGVVLGVIITKTFDIIYKRLEYKQEAKKIKYNEKLKTGEKAIKYLQTFNDQLFIIRELIEQLLENDDLNQELFEGSWKSSHKKLEELSHMTMEMLNSAYFYYDLGNTDYTSSTKELYNNISKLLNMKKKQDFSNSSKILTAYKKSILIKMSSNKEIISMIIKQSKE